MKRISGRVLVKETNVGIADLVVAVFDWDKGGRVEPGHHQPPAGDPAQVDLSLRTIDQLENRLGSVLTDANGNFELPIDEATAQHYGQNKLADLVVVVLAPEDSADNPDFPVPATFADRVIHVSRRARYNAGPYEAYLIRIPRKRLDQMRIPVNSPVVNRTKSDIHAERAADLQARKDARLEWLTQVTPEVQARLDRKKEVRKKAKENFEGLSGASPALQKYPFWVKPGQDSSRAHTAAMQTGLARLAGSRGGITLTLQAHEVTDDLGLTLKNGVVTGSAEPAAVAAKLAEATAGGDLVRVRWLTDACQPLEQRLKSAQDNCTKVVPVKPDAAPDPAPGGAGPAPQEPKAPLTAGSAAEVVLDRVIGQIQGLRASEIADTEVLQALATLNAEINALRTKPGLVAPGEVERLSNQVAVLAATIAGGIGKRSDVDSLMEDIKKMRLNGGPADATAFHDFHVVQVAFKHVWTQAFDGDLRDMAEAIYKDLTQLYDDAGITVPDPGSIQDVEQLKEFIKSVRDTIGLAEVKTAAPPTGTREDKDGVAKVVYDNVPTGTSGQRNAFAPPPPTTTAANLFPEAVADWYGLSPDQQLQIEKQAIIYSSATSDEERTRAKRVVAVLLGMPDGATNRLSRMILELGQMMSEPYAFDVFAPYTYNFGIMTTYRQRWEPLDYQAGNLVATIPLAPGETRKYSKRTVVKKSRAEKEIERSMSSHSYQSSQTSRAETEIMKKASTGSNFKMTTHGSFNVGIGSFETGTEFATNQEQHSASNKKDFHESTMKAAEEYRQERSLEVDTTTSQESEETSSGEIANPNNEITVTYLFYELQRRYRITEHLHRARPVILVAQDVPAPHEINEAWLIAHQWIIARALLDDLFRPALEYLATGMAGDEVALQVIRAHWETQRRMVATLEGQTKTQLRIRDELRQFIMNATRQKDINDSENSLTGVLFNSLEGNPLKTIEDYGKYASQSDYLEANRKAAETRLTYVEDSLADAQKKLQQATGQFEQATRDLSGAMQKSYSRHVAIDQLRIHVKQNILYYMHAIWDTEPPDQRFFRHYNKKVEWFTPSQNCQLVPVEPAPPQDRMMSIGTYRASLNGGVIDMAAKHASVIRFKTVCEPVIANTQRDLVEVADLDSPLGYKGNYIIFPLKESCYLTDHMLREYIHAYFGVRDPDPAGNYSIEELGCFVNCVVNDPDATEADKETAKAYFLQRLSKDRPASDEIIVPTGQLFIEALPGTHAVLEDFKLLHRMEDVRKVRAEVRHAEMENLRLAARLVAGEREDPDIEKRIIVDKGAGGFADM